MNRKFFAIAAMLLLVPMMMGAQALKGSYFLDNSLNRNRLNPAFAPEANYIAVPAVGNYYGGLSGNIGWKSILYPMNGQVYTFLNKNVTMDQIEAALPENPHRDAEMNMSILNFGWRHNSAYWTVDVGLRSYMSGDFSRNLFLAMKQGSVESGTYNLGPVKMNLSGAFQASVGYSKDLSELVPGLSVGAKVRGILPVAYAGLDMRNVSLDASPEKWTLNTDMAMDLAVNGLALVNTEEGTDVEGKFSGFSGFGMSFDLGAEYRFEFDGFINGVSVSAAVTDLGFINYNAKSSQSYAAKGNMDWTGAMISLEEGSSDGAMGGFGEELKDAFKFEKIGGGKALKGSTLPSFYLGAEMPFLNNMMSVGALYSARKSYNFTRNEFMLSYNATPLKWLSAGLNYTFSNYSKTIGWVLEVSPNKGPSVFVGSDYTSLERAKAPDGSIFKTVSLAGRGNLHFGIAYTFKGK